MATALPVRTVVLMLTSCLLMSACAQTAMSRYRHVERGLESAVKVSTIGPKDILAIQIYGQKELSGEFEVSKSGDINFPLLGKVHINGLDASEIGVLLQGKLKNGYMRDPHVNIRIKEFNSQKIFVLGRVKTPGRFAFSAGMSVLEAVTLAGGFNTLADTNFTIVTRGKDRIPIPVEKIMQGLAGNFALEAGDIIYVPETVL